MTSRSFGTILRNNPKVEAVAKQFKTASVLKYANLPKNFDGRIVWKGLLSAVRDQGQCGNCYAFSINSQLADRFAIFSLGQIKFDYSVADLTICSHNFSDNIANEWKNPAFLEKDQADFLANRSCNGNTLYFAAEILYTDGCPTLQCFPSADTNPDYDVPNTSDSKKFPSCLKLTGSDFDTCPNSKTAMRKYRALTAYNIEPNELAIMNEIFTNGPISSGFMVFPNFLQDFDGTGIYMGPTTGENSVGGHACEILGFSEETVNGQLVKYWIIRNSWGENWGDKGYFKMKRNIAECQLEQNCVAMLPDFPGMRVIDKSIVPIEDAKDIARRAFTGHFIDPITGYYTTAIDKIKKGQLQGDLTPIIDPNFKLPNYETFKAGEISKYLPNAPNSSSDNSSNIIVNPNRKKPAQRLRSTNTKMLLNTSTENVDQSFMQNVPSIAILIILLLLLIAGCFYMYCKFK